MKLTRQQRQAQHIISHLIKNCWENPRFKKKLIENPIKTIEKVTGKPSHFPKGMRIKVEDQSNSNIIFFNLPTKPH
ncbi:hypothetical protein ACFQ1M_12065 [Sungkyunkwania multivorans]|uniref:Ribosomal protein S19 n=1 Tax=Sungkyunkwania multivorans TaxID=1173618 RepID=A0ABW3CYU6_9FLAO